MGGKGSGRTAESFNATTKMERSREVTKMAVTQQLALVSILSRFWPAHLCEPSRPQKLLKRLVCLHTPAGPFVWRVDDEELSLFAHLKMAENDAPSMASTDKLAVLLSLAMDGW